jgi:hypothetical protein
MGAFMRAVVFAILAVACIGTAEAQDYAESATYGDIELPRGFAPNPRNVTVSAGGDEDAEKLGGECTGKVANAPDVQIDWQAGGTLILDVISGSDTSLVVNNPDGDWVCDDDSGEELNPKLEIPNAEPGIYDIWVGVVDDATLPSATLRISGGAGGRAPAAAVAANGARTERGELRAGDALVEDSYRDRFTYAGRRGERVVFDLRSDAFDTVLIVRAPSGRQEENDDFESSTSRSALTLTLEEQGEYQIFVTSYDERDTGAYSLTITAPRAVAQQQPVTTHTGALARGDAMRPAGEFYDVYEFEGTPGGRVSIALTSDDFDPYLILVSPSGEVEENDDDETSINSLVETDLTESGTYRIRASSYEKDETGGYQLKITHSQPLTTAQQAGRDTTELALGTAAQGRLERGDQEPERGKFQDVYAFRGTTGQNIRVELTSQDFDTFVAVKQPNGTVVDNDDFEGSTSRSVVELRLPETGRYQIVVSSYDDGDTGAYRLLASLSAGAQAPVAQAPAPAAGGASGNVYGVFAGISDYGGRIGDLDYTADDPVLVRDALIQHAGMAAGNALTLVDGRATTANLRDAFRTMASRVGPNDVFVFFFSGHGGQVDRLSGPDAADADGMDETIELYDASLLDNDLRAMFGDIRGRVLIILDSCFSGGFSKDIVSAPGRMGLFSSEEDVTSLVADKFRAGGYLSIFFKEAIEQGRADGDSDNAINAVELSQYLHERYRTEAQSKSAPRYVSSPNFGYQHLVVDRGGIRPYDVIFRTR